MKGLKMKHKLREQAEARGLLVPCVGAKRPPLEPHCLGVAAAPYRFGKAARAWSLHV